MYQSTFTGNLGADPDFKYTNDGTEVCTFIVAISQGKDKPPVWARVTAWGELAKRLVGYNMTKGQRVVVCSDRVPSISTYEKKVGGMGINFDVRATWVEVQGVTSEVTSVNQVNQGKKK